MELYHTGMRLYWTTLGLEPSLDALTFDNMRWAVAKFVPKAYGATDGFASKQKIYKAFRAFYEYLMEAGIKSDAEWRGIVKYKPQRKQAKRSAHLSASQLMDLINANRYQQGRSFFDRQLTHTLLYLYAFAGLRRSEALRLKISDIKFNEDYIHVFNAKGGKSRNVVMWPILARQLKRWLEYLPDAAKAADRLICNAQGEPLTANAVNIRFLRLTRREGAPKINIHGLRLTFATEIEAMGMNWMSLKKNMGHSDIKVTEGYVKDTPHHDVEWMRKQWALYQQMRRAKPVEPTKKGRRRKGEDVT